MGTIRPLVDEYMDDQKRVDFMRRYGDYLLEGVELEHLVADPNGSISGMDLGMDAIRTWGIDQDDRFNIVRVPYKAGKRVELADPEDDDDEMTGSEQAMERSRALYRAWNKQKAAF